MKSQIRFSKIPFLLICMYVKGTEILVWQQANINRNLIVYVLKLCCLMCQNTSYYNWNRKLCFYLVFLIQIV